LELLNNGFDFHNNSKRSARRFLPHIAVSSLTLDNGERECRSAEYERLQELIEGAITDVLQSTTIEDMTAEKVQSLIK